MIGTTLGHYRITSKLGHGGMGEVYLAEDTKLKRQVALKVLPADLSNDPERLARFQREAETVAALNHPNIVTMYSVEEDNGVRFLTMELVDGKALDELIPKAGLRLDEIFEIAIPFADALSSAHQKGIIHRDLKPANVMVTEKGRVKVLDFGLAKLAEDPEAGGDSSEDATEALTQEGKVMGTVPYMSPEQVQGKPLDARSDIFSLGIILYEMVTGARPFKGETSADLISAILRDQPDSVSDLKGELPHHLGRIVRHCMEKDPQRRYQSALDVRNELEDLQKEMESGAVRSETVALDPVRMEATGRPRWAVPAALGAVLLALGIAGWRMMSGGGESVPTTPSSDGPLLVETEPGQPSIAVLFFDNLSGDEELDWLRTGLTDMLVTDLSQSPDLRVLSTNRLYQILSDMKRLDERITSFDVISEVAGKAKADTVILGSFAKLGETIRISIKIQEAATGEILEAQSVDASVEEDLFARIDDLSRNIRQSIELPEQPAAVADRALKEISTSSVEAYRYYVEGEEKHYQVREQEAIELYQKAVEADPEFAMAWAKLGTSHGNLGMANEQRTYAEKAMEHLDRLTEPERAYVEGRYYGGSVATLARAIETYSTTLERFPHLTSLTNNLGNIYLGLWMYDEGIDILEQGVRYGDEFPGSYDILANAYLTQGDTERAFATIEGFLDRFPDRASSWATLAMIHATIGEFEAAEEALARADDAQPGFFFNLFTSYFVALLQDDWQAVEIPIQAFGQLPIPIAKAAEHALRSNVLLYRGRTREALVEAERGLDAVAPGPGRAQSHNGTAGLYLGLGEAEKALEHARAARAEDPGNFTDFIGHAQEAVIHQMLGQERRADLLADELDRRVEAIPGTLLQLVVHEVRGRLALLRGDSETAVRELEAASELLPGYDNNIPRVRYALGEAYLAADRLRDAERVFREVSELTTARTFGAFEYVRSFYQLGAIYEQLGDARKAAEAYQRFVDYWGSGDVDRDRVEQAQAFLGSA